MFCVSDTRSKMKKCPKMTGETYEVKREWCMCQGERCAHVLFSLLSLCAFFSFYSVLLFPVFGTRCLCDFNVKSGGCLVTYLFLSWKTMS